MPRPRGLLWLLGGTLLALAPLGLSAPADAPKPDARKPADGLDDPLPKGAFARLGTTRWRHGNAVTSVAFGPGGKMLAAAGIDNAVRIWEVSTGRELRHFPGQGDNAPPARAAPGRTTSPCRPTASPLPSPAAT